MARDLTFRPLQRADLPRLEAWLRADHVARWWKQDGGSEAKYFGNDRPVRHFMVIDGHYPIAMIQYYYWHDLPDRGAEVNAKVGEIGIDYLIGDMASIGKGIGPEIIASFLRTVTHARGDVAGVRVEVDEANKRSWRALEKLGFERELDGLHLEAENRPRCVYVLENRLAGMFGSEQIDAIIEHVRGAEAPSPMRHRVIAIDGPGGSGKSTLAVLLSRCLGPAPIIHTDDFASSDNTVNWYPRMLEQMLIPLSEGTPARYQRYDWDRKQMAEWHELDPPDFIVLEGVTASRQAFRPYLTSTIWVQTDREERLRRGLERDGQQARALWEEWMSEEDHYIAREHPEKAADIVISGQSRVSGT